MRWIDLPVLSLKVLYFKTINSPMLSYEATLEHFGAVLVCCGLGLARRGCK